MPEHLELEFYFGFAREDTLQESRFISFCLSLACLLRRGATSEFQAAQKYDAHIYIHYSPETNDTATKNTREIRNLKTRNGAFQRILGYFF